MERRGDAGQGDAGTGGRGDAQTRRKGDARTRLIVEAARGRKGETAIRSHTGGVAFEGCKVEG
jgi:hypothetical protein